MSGLLRRLLRIAARPMRRDRGQGGYVVHPYRGYGSRHEVLLMGRVFRQAALGEVIPRYGVLRDLADVIRRVFRRGLPQVTVEVTLGENVTTVPTDRDGYFDVLLPIEHPCRRTAPGTMRSCTWYCPAWSRCTPSPRYTVRRLKPTCW